MATVNGKLAQVVKIAGDYVTLQVFERTGIGEYILKIKVVIVCHTHTAQNDLIRLGTKCHVCHYLVKRLVRKWKSVVRL